MKKTRVISSRLVLALVAGVLLPVMARAQQVAITFDDLPVHSALPSGETRMQVAASVLQTLKAANMPPVYGFVNGVHLQRQPQLIEVLDAWRAAGNPLGDHSWSHMDLNKNSLEEFESNVLQNQSVLRKAMGKDDWRWLRFPYLSEGDTQEKRAGVRAFLLQQGYRIAGVTMSFEDYAWNEPYARCSAKGDTAAITQLESSYLAAAASSIDYYRGLSKTLYGRDIPYVLLMHIGAFDARMLPRLLELYRSRGFTFITLNQAEKDEFYREDTDLALPPGPDNLEGAMWVRQMQPPARPHAPASLQTICK
ncbi:MAG TPA: polysaccharide deacetylase family protein [Acidobacteriaceae bacterium]